MTNIYVFVFLFVLLSISNFLSLKINIKKNHSYFLSCCIIILISFIFYYIQEEYNLSILRYSIFFFYLLSIILFLFIIKNLKKIDKNINLDFIIFFCFVFFLSESRYYLDQDEFTYWGKSLKKLLLLNEISRHEYTHHPKGLDLFRYLVNFNNYKEGLVIFSNNILLISSFFYLFYERKLSIFDKFFLFLIYYLLLNNLSFGFVSIYSDPILAIFFSCLLKFLYFFFVDNNKKKLNLEISFILIFFSLLLINRASPIYAFFSLFFLLIIVVNLIKKIFLKYIIFFIFLLLLILTYDSFLTLVLKGSYTYDLVLKNLLNFFNNNFFSKDFLELFTSPIYFSHFGALINGILNFFSFKDLIPEFKIPIYLYIFFLSLTIFFNFKYKFLIFFFSLSLIFVFSIVVFVLKFQVEKLSILALQRYIGILVLSIYIFYVAIINANYKKYYYNKFILIFFILLLVSVTPKKTIGFFVSNKIYYSDLNNKIFKDNRDKIRKLREEAKDFNNIILIHKNNFSDFSNNYQVAHHSFYNDVILYELFPKKIKLLEYNSFTSDSKYYFNVKENKIFFIFYDLTLKEIEISMKKIFPQNFFIINTY
jgi:hypothetical protein